MHRRRLKIRLKMFGRLLAAKQVVLIVESDGRTRCLWDCKSPKAKKDLLGKYLHIAEQEDLS